MQFQPGVAYRSLDVSLQVHVEWILDTATDSVPQALPSPVPLSDYDWFSEYHDEFLVLWLQQDLSEAKYHTCPEGQGLEAPRPYWEDPDPPLTSDGYLEVHDVHGGISSEYTRILINRAYTEPDGKHYEFIVLIGWTPPGTYPVTGGENDDFIPGKVAEVDQEVRLTTETHIIALPFYVVEHVSCDNAGGASLRDVDASDLSGFCAEYGNAVRWGFGDDEQPNFQYNVAPFGDLDDPGSTANRIDGSDLSMIVADLNAPNCVYGIPKAGEEPSVVLRWFGLAPTGRTLVMGPTGLEIPEYDVVDWEQLRRAIANPYGYRRVIGGQGVETVPWSRVKTLYRAPR